MLQKSHFKIKFLVSLKMRLIFFLIAFSFLSDVYAQPIDLNILTYNIRYANKHDGENTWEKRKEAVFLNIKKEKPSIFGLQEVLAEQLTDVKKEFPTYHSVGVGRDDGKNAGEFSPLFFDSLQFSLISSSTFWLSPTPEVCGSKGWDAACNRIVTWMRLKAKDSGKELFVFCTHFDHISELARRNSANLLLHAIDSLATDFPAIVLGDFNANPESEPYEILTGSSYSFRMIDSKSISSRIKGPDMTFSGFEVGSIKGERIDYIFLKGEIHVELYTTINDNNGKYYPSDHLPVSASIKIL